MNNQNLHIEHIEDLLIDKGVNGVREAINTFRDLRDLLKGKTTSNKPSLKFDGAPAIISGIDQADGQFFVAKKSAFNKVPLIYKSVKEINSSEDLSQALKNIFILLFKYLPRDKVKCAYQGDFLFSKDTIKNETIKGQDYLTWHPNTIVYALPVDNKSENYKKVKAAKVGIAFHTEYPNYNSTQSTTWSSRPNTEIYKIFECKDVYAVKPEIQQENLYLSYSDQKIIDNALSDVGKIFQQMNPDVLNDIGKNKQLATLIKTFYNSKVKNNTVIESMKDISKYVEELYSYIDNKYADKIASYKTDKAKERVTLEKDDVLSYFTKYRESQVEKVFILFNKLSAIKYLFITKMNELVDSKAFIKTTDGNITATSQEGFVCSTETGGLVKLVDRMEFSKNNFSKDVLKGF